MYLIHQMLGNFEKSQIICENTALLYLFFIELHYGNEKVKTANYACENFENASHNIFKYLLCRISRRVVLQLRFFLTTSFPPIASVFALR